MNQTVYTIIGFTVIFVLNALGSAFVFFFKKDASPKANTLFLGFAAGVMVAASNTLFLGFAAGVMVAASFFSLLLPAFEGVGSWGVWSFIPVAVGFLLGGVFLVLLDKIVPHIHFGTNEEEGLHSSLKKPDEALFCCDDTQHSRRACCRLCVRCGGNTEYRGGVSCRSRALDRHQHSDFSRRGSGGTSVARCCGQQGKGFRIRNIERCSRTCICRDWLFPRGILVGGAAVAFGVRGRRYDLCRRGRYYSRCKG